MYEVLKQHALDAIWCNPTQDNQIRLGVKRISSPGGEIVSAEVMRRRVTLPKLDRRFHVFWVGQAHPKILNLLPQNPDWAEATWIPFSDAVNNEGVFVDLYVDYGVHLPLHRTYYMYTDDRALILAVDITSKSLINYETDQLYLRVYSNAYYASTQASGLTTDVKTNGALIVNSSNILQLQSEIANLRTLPGTVLCFKNGLHIDDISPVTVGQGDVVEYIYDASIKSVVDIPVTGLQTFTSQVDNCFKYLIHFAGQSSQIDYVDDIDLYCLNFTGSRYQGTHIHRNLAKTLRMVTHRDYSLAVDTYVAIANQLAGLLGLGQTDPHSYTVRLYIRQGGMIRPLVYENQRVFELYKLPDDEIVRALIGVDSSMPYWRADNLEASGYTQLMRSSYLEAQDITLIEKAMGYNAIAKYVGDTPSQVQPNAPTGLIYPPQAAVKTGTMYEYDANGNLLGFYPNVNSEIYKTQNAATTLVECISGEGSWTSSVVEGTDGLPIPAQADYRVYMCYLVNGQPNLEWKDITGTNFYTVVNGKLVWANQEFDQWLQVRTNEKFLAFEVDIVPVAGTVYMDLTEYVGAEHRIMSIPMGDLDIWLNGKSLIKDLDYYLNFPRVYITAKEHLVQPAGSTPQKVTVRFTGFCDDKLQLTAKGDYGFVQYGFLSQNSRFNIRDDKVLRITVRGSYRDRSSLKFSEDHSGVEVLSALNGSPYQVKDVVVPIDSFCQTGTYPLLANSQAVDAAVENYLSTRIPDPTDTTPSVIPKRYLVYSPFFAHIINDVNTGQIDRTKLQANLTDMDVMDLVKDYLPLLEFDPLNTKYNIDSRYVLIHPTNLDRTIEVDLYGYQFIDRVKKLYGRGLIDLSQSLNISLGGTA